MKLIKLTPDLFTKYPDGQQDITKEICKWEYHDQIEVATRLNSFADIERLILATTYLRKVFNSAKFTLWIPYLLGARGDRDFGYQVAYLKDVIAPIINGLNYDFVKGYHPHSVVSHALINNYTDKNAAYFPFIPQDSIIVAPDAGASKYAEKVKHVNSIEPEIVLCTKKRNKEGKIIETIVYCGDFKGKDVYIVDDICSYGGTFKAIANIIKERNAGKIYLVVSHYEGVANLEEMKDSGIEHIYITNSIGDIENEMITQTKII